MVGIIVLLAVNPCLRKLSYAGQRFNKRYDTQAGTLILPRDRSATVFTYYMLRFDTNSQTNCGNSPYRAYTLQTAPVIQIPTLAKILSQRRVPLPRHQCTEALKQYSTKKPKALLGMSLLSAQLSKWHLRRELARELCFETTALRCLRRYQMARNRALLRSRIGNQVDGLYCCICLRYCV